MIRKSQSNAAVPSLIALVAVLVLVCPAAHAQVKPFKITGAGIGPHGLPLPGQPPRPHWAIGDATHLGRYYGEGSVQTLTASPDGEGGFTGTFQSGVPFMFVAANGDVLACDYGRDGDDPGTGSPSSSPSPLNAPAGSRGSPVVGRCTRSPNPLCPVLTNRWLTRGEVKGRSRSPERNERA
jgi:hypothetical protein